MKMMTDIIIRDYAFSMYTFKQDHKQASIALYSIVALNSGTNLEQTLNKREASTILADLLQIHRGTPLFWFRGNFDKHPFSHENFLKFSRIYRSKAGLESPKEIKALAIALYGVNYKKAIELLDPADRENEMTQDDSITLPDKPNLTTAICNLIESSPPDEVGDALLTKIAFEWSARNSRYRNLLM